MATTPSVAPNSPTDCLDHQMQAVIQYYTLSLMQTQGLGVGFITLATRSLRALALAKSLPFRRAICFEAWPAARRRRQGNLRSGPPGQAGGRGYIPTRPPALSDILLARSWGTSPRG